MGNDNVIDKHSPFLPLKGEISQRTIDAGVRTVLNVASAWMLSDHQTENLLSIGNDRLQGWQRGEIESLTAEQLERISLVLGIYKTLQILLPGAAADGWVHRPNTASLFGSRPAIEVMCTSLEGLVSVKRYLLAQSV